MSKSTVTLIDLSSLFWSAWHTSAEDALSAARERTLAMVQRCAAHEADALIAVCMDVGRSFRRDKDPTYKANRPEKDQNALGELAKLKDRLVADGFWLVGANTFEADDVIATLAMQAVRKEHPVLICTADKDLFQLAQPGVKFLRTPPCDWSVFTETDIVEKYGVPVHRFGDYLALVGDSSDNIKGLEGVGPKKAAKLIADFGSLEGIWKAAEEVTRPLCGPAVDRLIRTEGTIDAVSKGRILIQLRTDAPVDFEEIYKERKPVPLVDLPSIDDAAPTEEHPPEETVKGIAMPTHVTALAVRDVPFELQLEPTSAGNAIKLAQWLSSSRLYPRFGTPEAILAVILRGRSIGLGAGAALDSFHVVEGRLCPTSQLIIARAKADPDCEYFMLVESDETHAIWETKHRSEPRPTRMIYTVDMAKKAGVWKKDGAWDKRPTEMCRKTCGAQLGRAVYPGSTGNLYGREEMDDE